jgi:hypothetical protein
MVLYKFLPSARTQVMAKFVEFENISHTPSKPIALNIELIVSISPSAETGGEQSTISYQGGSYAVAGKYVDIVEKVKAAAKA